MENLLRVQELGRVRTLKLLQLLLLLLLVFVHPDYSGLIGFHYVHFVVGAVLGGQVPRLFDVHATEAVFLPDEIIIVPHILTALRELVFETRLEALVQVVVRRIFLQRRELFALVKDLADEDAVHADAALTTKVHDARIGVALFEKQVLVIFVDEVDFDFVQAFVQAFQDHMMPIWTQSQKLSEIFHIVFENGHGDSRFQHTIGTSKLKMSLFLLDVDGALLVGICCKVVAEMVRICWVPRSACRQLRFRQPLIIRLWYLCPHYSMAGRVLLQLLSAYIPELILVIRAQCVVARCHFATRTSSWRTLPRTSGLHLNSRLHVLVHSALLLFGRQLIISTGHAGIDVLYFVKQLVVAFLLA